VRELGRRTPIVALTAGALHSDEANCLAAGMDAFIAKPIEIAKLAAVLRRWDGEAEENVAQMHSAPEARI